MKKQNHVDFDKDQANELLLLVEDKIDENILSEYILENKTSYENAENWVIVSGWIFWKFGGKNWAIKKQFVMPGLSH